MMESVKQDILYNHENELTDLLQNNSILSITDKYGRIIYANDRFCEIIGSNRNNIIGETHELIKSHLHTDILYKKLWKTIKSGEVWKGVLPNKLVDGRFYWLDTTITPVKDENGDISRYIAVYNDITDYYNKKGTIKMVDPKGKTLSQNFLNVDLSINSFGKILKAKNKILNTSIDDVVGLYVYDFINPVSHNVVKKQIKKVFNESESSEFETIEFSSKGQQTFYVSKIEPVYNNHNEIIYATIVTKKLRKDLKIKKELRHIEAKYSTIFQSINVGIIVVTDSKGNITEWNKGAESAFGYTEDEVIGNSLTMLISDQHLITSVKELLKAKNHLNENKNGENLEMIGLKKCGQEFPVEFSISNWDNGKEKFYCAMMLDISNRKKLENKLKQKTEDLELFLYRSAHDLKAPLTSAEGLLNLIKGEDINSNVKLLTTLLDTTLERGKLLVDNLSYASAIQDKSKETNTINFKKVIDDTLKTLSGLKNFESIKFEITINQLGIFYSNKELINSIFQNLIHNAIKYSKPISNDHTPIIKIEINQSENKVNITVKDNGIGIDEKCIGKIFDLYYRVDNEQEQGSGLGLYIVKRIVDDFNGEIKVKSEQNEGTFFELTLPNFIKN